MPERAAIETALADEVLRSFGKLQMIARGSSMIPTIYPGDVLLVERQPFMRLHPGRIVLALRDGRFFAHRIVQLTAVGGPPLVITRGDALREDDPAFFHDEIVGGVKAVLRGRKRIELDSEVAPGWKRSLRWAVRNFKGIGPGLLWCHARLHRARMPARDPSVRTPTKLAECS